ncbi:MAG: outer membrane beta-barrel protein [Caulobacteraceae bacterium]
MKITSAGMVLLSAMAGLLAAPAARGQEVAGYGLAPGYGGAAPHTFSEQTSGRDMTRHTTVDVIGDLIYDSNVARGSAAVAAERHIKPADEIFIPSATVDAYMPVGREGLFLIGNAGYDFYRRNSVLDRERLDIHGGADAQLGPCRQVLSGLYARYQSNLEELTLATTKNTEQKENVSFNTVCGRSYGLQPSFGVSEDWSGNSAAVRHSADFRTFGLDWGLAYVRPVLGELSLFGTYRRTDFPNRDLIVGNTTIQDGYQLLAGGAKYDRHLGARIEGWVSVSYTSLQLNLPSAKGFKGLTYSTDWTYRASSRLKGHFDFARATLPSNRLGASFTLDQLLTGDVDYLLGPRLTLVLGASRDARQFEGPALIPSIEISNEIVYTGFVTASYALSRRLSLVLDVRRQQRDANLVAFSYGDTRFDLTVMAKF